MCPMGSPGAPGILKGGVWGPWGSLGLSLGVNEDPQGGIQGRGRERGQDPQDPGPAQADVAVLFNASL